MVRNVGNSSDWEKGEVTGQPALAFAERTYANAAPRAARECQLVAV